MGRHLILGGSGGIGSALARRLAGAGHEMILAGRDKAGNDALAEAVARMHPLPRLGRAEDMAATGELLLTDAGSWITGQIVGIDGGRARLDMVRG